jgi:hypothetical protein
MIQITVSDVEARAISEASPPFVIVDPQGKPLGQITPVDPDIAARAAMSAEEWDEIKRRMAEDDGTRYTWAEVKEYLRTLAPE